MKENVEVLSDKEHGNMRIGVVADFVADSEVESVQFLSAINI